MNFNFGEVLSRAWQIVWKHKVFWIFGILTSCSRGGTSFNWNFNGGSGGGAGELPNLPPQLEQFFRTLAENAVSIIAVTLALVCIIWIVAIFLGTIGRIGLIRGTGQVEAGGTVAFGQLFSESMPFFWRVFGLSLLVGLPFVILIGALVAGGLVLGFGLSQGGNAPSALSLLALLPFFIGCICLLIPIGIVINLIVRQAERSIVLENAGVLPALSRGWEIFRSNLGPIILMALILWVISLVVGFVVAIPILIVVIPTTFAFVAGSAAGNAPNWAPMGLGLACLCILAPLLWLINGILMAYMESAWTLTYLRLTRPVDPAPVILEANA